jgi:hypothetical protein
MVVESAYLEDPARLPELLGQALLESIRISGVSMVRSSAGHPELVGPGRSTPEILMLSSIRISNREPSRKAACRQHGRKAA